MPEFKQRLRVKPGIAGLAQVRGDYWLSSRKKLKYDNLYIKTLNPWIDIKLLCLAVWIILCQKHRSKTETPDPGYQAIFDRSTPDRNNISPVAVGSEGD